MARRDWRSHKSLFVLYISCIAIGVAALVALQSFGKAVRVSVEEQSRDLLGADLVVKSRFPIAGDWVKDLENQMIAQASEKRFASMGNFVDNKKPARLIQVRAVSENYPLFGEVVTSPRGGVALLKPYECLVERALLIQYKAEVGDKIRLGQQVFSIKAGLESLPGESMMVAELSPRILIREVDLTSTGLMGFGSRVFYRENFAYGEKVQEKELLEQLAQEAGGEAIRYETVTQRQENINKVSQNLFHFLNLTSLMALVLGGIGIGSAIHVYISRRLRHAAVLRCLGAPLAQTFAVYLLQALLLGFGGGLLGVLGGLLIQFYLPEVIGQFFPVKIPFVISWASVVMGLVLGVVSTLLFSLNTLLRIRRVSPLESLRIDFDVKTEKGLLNFVIYALIVLSVLLFSVFSSSSIKVGLALGFGLIIVFALLLLSGKVFMYLIRRLVPHLLSYTWRQGLRNLFRPQNQTLVLVLSMGTGVFIIALLFLVRENLLYQVRRTEQDSNPNMVLFDIQYDQVSRVRQILENESLPIYQEVPIVDLRLRQLKGQKVEDLLAENRKRIKKKRIPLWTLMRSYRCTYRDQVLKTESLVEGEFESRFEGDYESERIPISVEEGLMEKLQLELGDHMTFELSGTELPCRISSIRRVEWMQMRPNFFVVFPDGVLNEAPQMTVMVSRTPSDEASARVQDLLTQEFNNISFLDLTLVLSTVNEILTKVGLAIRFMAGFSIFTGFFVLFTTLMLSQRQRLRENVLLKIIGATRKQVTQVQLAEFAFLAILSANAGVLPAYLANYLLGKYAFENTVPFNGSIWLGVNLGLLALTLLMGFFFCRGFYKKTSFEALQSE